MSDDKSPAFARLVDEHRRETERTAVDPIRAALQNKKQRKRELDAKLTGLLGSGGPAASARHGPGWSRRARRLSTVAGRKGRAVTELPRARPEGL